MSTYVISDIHGEYDLFIELLDKIGLRDEDTLYVLGDVLDRGPHPIKTIHKLMEMPNAICLAGNHEFMALDCLDFLMREITDKFLADLDEKMLSNYLTWQQNGCETTINEFSKLELDEKQDVIEFIKEFQLYEELFVNGKEFLLVHSGFGNYRPDKGIGEYSVMELVWERIDYDKGYFPGKTIVSGHTPTQGISGNSSPGSIYRRKNHIAIDCGAFISGGRLAALCLDTGEEYYSSDNAG